MPGTYHSVRKYNKWFDITFVPKRSLYTEQSDTCFSGGGPSLAVRQASHHFWYTWRSPLRFRRRLGICYLIGGLWFDREVLSLIFEESNRIWDVLLSNEIPVERLGLFGTFFLASKKMKTSRVYVCVCVFFSVSPRFFFVCYVFYSNGVRVWFCLLPCKLTQLSHWQGFIADIHCGRLV